MREAEVVIISIEIVMNGNSLWVWIDGCMAKWLVWLNAATIPAI
jgi:hypothetical protein